MQSTFEWRRNAIGWWLSKAENARFCALALSRQNDETAVAMAANNDYNGTPSIALYEGFRREAAKRLGLSVTPPHAPIRRRRGS